MSGASSAQRLGNSGMACREGESGAAEPVAFGHHLLANSDLPKRLALDAPLNQPNPKTYYKAGPEGYTDYPAL